MKWAFRLVQTPQGVAVHHVYFDDGADSPISCAATPFVAEAADVDDLRSYLELILKDAFQNPVLDGRNLGLFDADLPASKGDSARYA